MRNPRSQPMPPSLGNAPASAQDSAFSSREFAKDLAMSSSRSEPCTPSTHDFATIPVLPLQCRGGYVAYDNGDTGPYSEVGNGIGGKTWGGRFDAFWNDIYDENEANANPAQIPANYASDHSQDSLIDDNRAVATIDHIYPSEKGGLNSFRNAQVLSISENGAKSDEYPTQYGGQRQQVAVLVTSVNDIEENRNEDYKVGDVLPVDGFGAAARIDASGSGGHERMMIRTAYNKGLLDMNLAPEED